MSKVINAIESGDHPELATLLREIYRRSMTEPEFRALALNDATAAFEAVGGTLTNWNIKFVDSEEGIEDVFMLPPAIETAPELTAEELEAVAGGGGGCGCCSGVTSEAEVGILSY